MEPKAAAESRSVLSRWMGITDTNRAGNVHGGKVMQLCDEAAALAAIKHSGGRVVTAAMDRMAFIEPAYVGELVTCQAIVNAVWRSSMEVGVRVEAENPVTGEKRHTSTAYLTLVALDGEGRPCRVPPLLTETEAEHRREREAQFRRQHHLAEREEILAHRKRIGEPTPTDPDDG